MNNHDKKRRSFLPSQRFLADPDRRQQIMIYVLGALGWLLIYLNFPFDWELPRYAGY